MRGALASKRVPAGLLMVSIGLIASGCGTGSAEVSSSDRNLGLPISTVRSPYRGSLDIALVYADRAGVRARAGAAARALECTNDPWAGGGSNYAEGGPETVQPTISEAVDDFFATRYGVSIPLSGYRIETRQGRRVLISFDVQDRTKAAVVLASNMTAPTKRRGWGVTAWAECDPSEFPQAVTDALGVTVWTYPDGARIPLATVRSFTGSPDCSPHATFLDLGSRTDPDEYVRQPTPDMADWLTSTYSANSELPPTATNTGFRNAGREVWLGHEREAAYLVSLRDPSDVERWPGTTRPIRCG